MQYTLLSSLGCFCGGRRTFARAQPRPADAARPTATAPGHPLRVRSCARARPSFCSAFPMASKNCASAPSGPAGGHPVELAHPACVPGAGGRVAGRARGRTAPLDSYAGLDFTSWGFSYPPDATPMNTGIPPPSSRKRCAGSTFALVCGRCHRHGVNGGRKQNRGRGQ